jgi:GDPmannose 4,6-dehydratase
MKTALIFGVSGQDGAYLSRFLLGKGYLVHGVSRDAARNPFARLLALGIRWRVATHSASMRDFDELRRLIEEVRPDEIYNLSGLSSVGLSFAAPELAWESIAGAQTLLLDVVRAAGNGARLYHSASGDCFGETPHGSESDVTTPFAPLSPYAAAKAAAYRATAEYRQAYGLYACSGIVYSHESPLRGERFVTKKIVAAAAAAGAGLFEGTLPLGNLTASRDWGYAAEYVEAMWLMLQQEQPENQVIATGESATVEELAAAAFGEFDLDYREYVVVDRSLLRPSDIPYSRGNPARARRQIGWQARTKFPALVRLLADEARSRLRMQSERSPRRAAHPAHPSVLPESA